VNLALDIGNTFAKSGVFEGDELVEVFRLESTHLFSHGEDWIQTIRNKYPGIEKGIYSTVIHLEPEFLSHFEFLNPFLSLHPGMYTGFENHYQSPSSLGLDRIAAISGALAHFPKENCLVVNAGTCLTFDFVDDQKRYYGGGISPGYSMRVKALNTFTSKLPLINQTPNAEPDYMGKTTSECMHAGVYWGMIHEVMGFINQYGKDYSDIKIILAGGDGNFLDTHLKNTIFAHQIKWMPDLVLIGLNRILNIKDA